MPIDTNYEELVFVGGPADGKRLLVRDGDQIYNYYSTEPHPAHGLPAPRMDMYKRVTLVIVDGRNIPSRVEFMRDASLDDLGAMRRLLLGYQRKPRQTSTRSTASQMADRMRRSQRPHPHTSVEAGTGITHEMLVSSLRRLEEDYLRSPLEETQEANERAEAADLNTEGQS